MNVKKKNRMKKTFLKDDMPISYPHQKKKKPKKKTPKNKNKKKKQSKTKQNKQQQRNR